MALKLRDGLTFYFCRHGETEANVEKRFQGRTIDTPLTPKGLQQAADIAKILGRELGTRPDLAFFCSPLPRARTTMEIIRAGVVLPLVGYMTDTRLLEINLGSWDGLTAEEARALDPAVYDKRTAEKWNVRVPGGGEDYDDVARRAENFVADLTADSFAVSHGAFTRILRGLFQGLDWKQMSDLDEPQGCLFRARSNEVVRLDVQT
jgi:broad specificity phosphatase PhoE